MTAITTTTRRINQSRVAPEAMQAMLGLERYVAGTGLERSLLHLVKIRASQINGCGYCIDMHTREARADGETEQRIYLLDAWREAPFYASRERAALVWTEAVTKIDESHVPDDVFAEARAEFSEQELVALTMAVVAINGWNRLTISFRTVPGSHQPQHRPEANQ